MLTCRAIEYLFTIQITGCILAQMVRLSNFFGDGDELGPASHQVSQQQINLACVALFIEISLTDLKDKNPESLQLLETMRETMALAPDALHALMEHINLNPEPTIDIFPYAQMLKQHSSHAHKCAVLTAMWRIIWAQGSISAHSECLLLHMHQLLGLNSSDFAATRDSVKPNDPDIAS